MEENYQENYQENYKQKYEALLAGVNPEMLDDAIILANTRVTDEVSFADAIGSVVERYPAFSKQEEVKTPEAFPGKSAFENLKPFAEQKLSTGIYIGSKVDTLSGVEAEFLARNPGIKI
jgi:hypothetical protein